jgi:hypothetical protein
VQTRKLRAVAATPAWSDCTRAPSAILQNGAQMGPRIVLARHFVGSRVVITFDSARAVDASSHCNLTLCAQVVKKK